MNSALPAGTAEEVLWRHNLRYGVTVWENQKPPVGQQTSHGAYRKIRCSNCTHTSKLRSWHATDLGVGDADVHHASLDGASPERNSVYSSLLDALVSHLHLASSPGCVWHLCTTVVVGGPVQGAHCQTDGGKKIRPVYM